MINKKLIYISIFSFSWTLKIFFNKIALSKGVNPVAFIAQAVFVSVLILTAYMLIKNKSEIKYLNIDIYKGLFLAGSFLGIGYAIGLYGLKYSTSINYSFAVETPRASPWHLSTFRAQLDALRANFHSSTGKPVVFCPSG